MNFFAKLLTPFKKLWSLINSEKAKQVAQAIDGMLEKALPLVRTIAALTPTRSDDELIRLFERFGNPVRTQVNTWLALPVDQRGKALLAIGEQELQKHFPGVPLNQISAAISLAVSLMKASGSPQVP